MIFQLLLMAIKLNYSWTCQPITFSDSYSDDELRVNNYVNNLVLLKHIYQITLKAKHNKTNNLYSAFN